MEVLKVKSVTSEKCIMPTYILPWPMSWPSVSLLISYHDRCPDQVLAYQYLTMTDVLTKCQRINILPWPMSWPSVSLSISNHDRCPDQVSAYQYLTMTDVLTKYQLITFNVNILCYKHISCLNGIKTCVRNIICCPFNCLWCCFPLLLLFYISWRCWCCSWNKINNELGI